MERRATVRWCGSRLRRAITSSLRFGACDRVCNKTPRLRRIAPAEYLDPLAGLEVLVVLEEVLDLPDRDLRHLRIFGDVGVALGELRHRHRDDLFIAASVILHLEHTDRPHVDDGARHDRTRVGDQHVDRIAVLGQRMRHEAVIARIAHGGVQETIDHQGARSLIHLVFDRLAADRHLDDDVEVLGRVVADRNGVEAHDWAPRLWDGPSRRHWGSRGARRQYDIAYSLVTGGETGRCELGATRDSA